MTASFNERASFSAPPVAGGQGQNLQGQEASSTAVHYKFPGKVIYPVISWLVWTWSTTTYR